MATVNPPLDPPPLARPLTGRTAEQARTVHVRCATDNTLHTELGYAAKKHLTGGPGKAGRRLYPWQKTHRPYPITSTRIRL